MFTLAVLAGLASLVNYQSEPPPGYYELNSTYATSCSRAAVAAQTGPVRTEAIADCTRSLNSEPLNRLGMAQTLTNRGVLRLGARDRAGAMADFNAAIDEQPTLALAYLNRAGVHLTNGDYGRALADASEAVRLDGANAHAYLMRGGAHEMLGKTTQAYREYKMAERLDPSWDRPKTELARFKVTK